MIPFSGDLPPLTHSSVYDTGLGQLEQDITPRIKYSVEQIIFKLREAEVLLALGKQ
jgi:hypothetical protein